MNADFNKNHFELFGLTPTFRIDAAALEAGYRDLQAAVHPDRYAAGSDAEKRVSMQWATRANEAYRTLKQPVARARYLLSLQGVDTQEETNTAMPPEFLMRQMEWRESVQEARHDKNLAALDRLADELREYEKMLVTELDSALEGTRQDLTKAALIVRKLRFVAKLDEEIGDVREILEN
jgi:molecular chaperone HscB